MDYLCRTIVVRADPALNLSRQLSELLAAAGVQLDPNLTVSEQAQAARLRGEWWGRAVCQLLDEIDPGHCDRQPLISGSSSYQGLRSGQLDAHLVELLNSLADLSRRRGGADPRERITSGYRSPQYQSLLRQAWDRGERAGLTVRPASPTTSAHCQGKAVDISGTSAELSWWGAEWVKLGGTWGGRWLVSDPVHFQV